MSSARTWDAMQRRPDTPYPLNRRALIAGGLAGLVLPTAALADRPVVVASKVDGEGALLGNLLVLVLARLGVPVTARLLADRREG
jgi:osmoprotectant transport system substrate-binding protein